MNEDFEHSEEFDDIEELAKQFIEQQETGMPLYWDSDEFQDVIDYFLHGDSSDWEYARKALDIAMERYPADPYIRLLNASYYVLQEDLQRVEHELNYIEFQLYPIAELYVARVNLATLLKREVDALSLLQKALSLDAQCVDAYLLLMNEYVMAGNMPEAIKNAKLACKYGDENTLVEICSFAIEPISDSNQKSFYQLYELFFKQMTNEQPLESILWFSLGQVSLQNEHYEQAVEALKNCIVLAEPQSEVPHNGQPELMMHQMWKAVGDSQPYVLLAEAQFELHQYQEAIDNLQYVTKILGSNEYCERIGDCYLALQNYEAAIQNYCKVETSAPFGRNVVQNVAKILLQLGKFDEARAFMRVKISNQPDQIGWYALLLNLLYLKTDEDEIRSICDQVADSSKFSLKDKLFFLRSLVQFCYYNLAPNLGIEICQNYDQKGLVDKVILHYYLAFLYANQSMITMACDYLESALQQYPAMVFFEFLNMDQSLAEVPEFKELFDIYDIYAAACCEIGQIIKDFSEETSEDDDLL